MLDWAYTQSYLDVAILGSIVVLGFVWFVIKWLMRFWPLQKYLSWHNFIVNLGFSCDKTLPNGKFGHFLEVECAKYS